MSAERKETLRPDPQMLEQISDLFLKYGLRSTSMDDICRHLNISKKTLYQYFENKEQLVEAVFMMRHQDFDFEHIRQKIRPVPAIQILFGTVDHFLQSQQSLLPANMFDLKKYHPVVFEKLARHIEIFIWKFYTLVFKKGQDEGIFRTDIDRDIQIWLFGEQFGILRDPEKRDSFKFPLKDIVYTVTENFIRSVATEKGIGDLEKFKKTPAFHKKNERTPP
ncbi:MAG: TetR/AcrR family transcriptional regulator [Bacteroides sp.]|nr:TetR/AcrR family transcriptional regulator [Bacteroides sp.]MCM1531828.1 TetR/AcrR family transcriptional regulator [Ruminococcus flavefaciens]MCM1554780.1 TetR/AcrR family transcriptional regulator [Bacteroides sp.]